MSLSALVLHKSDDVATAVRPLQDGERVFDEIIEVASGKLTKAEVLGHHEFAIHSLGLSV